jgi:hypothetical protein
MRIETTTRTRKHLGCSDRSDIDGFSLLPKFYGRPGTRKGIPKAIRNTLSGAPSGGVGLNLKLLPIPPPSGTSHRWPELAFQLAVMMGA